MTAPGVRQARYGQVYVYLTWVFDPAAPLAMGAVEYGYGGQTTQGWGKRDGQHKADQPWADVIAEGPLVLVESVWEGRVDASGRWSSPDLDAVERAAIRGDWSGLHRLVARLPDVRLHADVVAACQTAGGRPRYNIEHNLDNPTQVPSWVALEQRHARDDARGVPRWEPPVRVPRQRRPVSARPAVPATLGVRAVAAVGSWWRSVRWWVAGWTAAAVTASGLVASQIPGATFGDAAWAGVVAGSSTVWLVWDRRRRRRAGRGHGMPRGSASRPGRPTRRR